jgi:uncharacterized protein (DUF433 family)
MSIAAPQIEIRDNRAGQPRAYVLGTRVRVLDVYALSEIQGLSPDDIAAAMPHLTLGQVHAALGYYFDHREEVVQQFQQEHARAQQYRDSLGPGPLAAKLQALDGGRDAISS